MRNSVIPFTRHSLKVGSTAHRPRYDVLSVEEVEGYWLFQIRSRNEKAAISHVAATGTVIKERINEGDIIVLQPTDKGVTHKETGQYYFLLKSCEKMGAEPVSLCYAQPVPDGHDRYIIEAFDGFSTGYHFVTLSRFDDRDGEKLHVFLPDDDLRDIHLGEQMVVDVQIDFMNEGMQIPLFGFDVAYEVVSFQIVQGPLQRPSQSNRPRIP